MGYRSNTQHARHCTCMDDFLWWYRCWHKYHFTRAYAQRHSCALEKQKKRRRRKKLIEFCTRTGTGLGGKEYRRLSDTNGLQDGFRLGLRPTKCQLADPSDFWNCRNNLFLMEEEDGVGYKLYNRRDRGCMSLYRYRDTTRASQSD